MNRYEPDKYWEELLSRDFSLTGVGYQGLGKNYNTWLYRARTRIMEWFLGKYAPDPGSSRILDIGCGTGFYVEFWRRRGARLVTGIDLTQKSVQELSAKYRNYNFYRKDIGEENIALEGPFDLITAFDVLFHIVDEDRFENAVRNISLLAHRGTLILISDNFVRKARAAGFNQVHRTIDRFTEVLDKNGIEILELKPVFYLMNGPIDIRNDAVLKWYSRIWGAIMSQTKRSERIGAMMGWFLYQVDGVLIRMFRNSITTELIVCIRK
jgi:SAM-dependent methyltransferase